MGFGTNTQIGNRTSLADMFRGNIGAPQPIGTTQQPNQLFTLLQSLLGKSQPSIQPVQPQPTFDGGGASLGRPSPGGETPLSGLSAQPAVQPISTPVDGAGANLGQLSNPFGKLINQRFVR